ncbi:MAG: non-canonical purine NTP pyrophosphatase, partial [Pseudomonadota bacterium]
IAALLAPFGLCVKSAGALNLPEPEETEPTFAGNAELKAIAAARASGLPALSDDSGLEVAALGGAPGIYSARWAGPSKDFTVAMRKVADELAQRHVHAPEARAANFICALSLAWPADGDIQTRTFLGRVDGSIVWPPRGDRGFGYDPIFLPVDHEETFGEMDPAAKHAMSHRADAFAQLLASGLLGSPSQQPAA